MKKILLILVCLFSLPGLACAVDIQEVIAPKTGIKAWLVEDHKLPLIAMQFSFDGGSEQDSADKQGLAALTVAALTEGAGLYSANAFQQQLADHSITINFGADRDQIDGGMKCLSTDKQLAFNLLRLSLTKPHFEAKDIERLRAQHAAAIRKQFADPNWQGRYALLSQLFAGHPYGQRHLGSLASLQSISRDDIKDFAAHHFARDTITVAVAGDITPSDLATTLDTVFGDLPAHAQLTKIVDISDTTETPTILVKREGTQTNLLFAMPGPKRDDPDWYATEIANYILGGGGFSARLMQDVRDKKGLTYGIGTNLSPMQHGGLIVGQAAVDNPKMAEALDVIRDTMHRFHSDGPTAREIAAAKDYLTGSQALGLTSTDKIAVTLVYMQHAKLGRDFLDRYNDLIRNVSAQDIERAISHWFNPDKITWVMVGKPEGVSATQTKDIVRQ